MGNQTKAGKNHLAMFTTKIPHHSSHSGYEQLVNYIDAGQVVVRERKTATGFFSKNIERAFRLGAVSRWYMWDGIEAEWSIFKLGRKHGDTFTGHILYGDPAIGYIPYLRSMIRGNVVLSIHACPSDLPQIIRRPKLLKNIDGLILLGENQKPFFLDAGVPEERLHVIYHGVDDVFFTPGDTEVRSESNKKAFEILMVGSWRRNFKLYADVCRRFEGNDDVRFTVISHDHNKVHFEGLSNVQFLSGLPDTELRDRYQKAGAMLLGLEDAVANNVLLEAMACGLPLVVERVGALPEYLSSEGGLFFDQNDVDGAASAIKQLREQPDLALKLSDTALQEVKEFQWPKMARKVEEVYKKVHRG